MQNYTMNQWEKYRKTFAQRLAELRNEKGLSVHELAKELGVTPLTIGRWEKTLCDIHGDSAIKVANYFDCSLDYLVGFEN